MSDFVLASVVLSLDRLRVILRIRRRLAEGTLGPGCDSDDWRMQTLIALSGKTPKCPTCVDLAPNAVV